MCAVVRGSVDLAGVHMVVASEPTLLIMVVHGSPATTADQPGVDHMAGAWATGDVVVCRALRAAAVWLH